MRILSGLGLSGNFNADFTVNPDFGQVEADPSIVNLTAFETFYDEKRPFFIEGSQMLEFGFSGQSLFYSRRIGRSPGYTPSLKEGEFISIDSTRTSLTGTGGNFEIGKGGNGRWRFEERISWRSPGLELNDIGFLKQEDVIEQGSHLACAVNEPIHIFSDSRRRVQGNVGVFKTVFNDQISESGRILAGFSIRASDNLEFSFEPEYVFLVKNEHLVFSLNYH